MSQSYPSFIDILTRQWLVIMADILAGIYFYTSDQRKAVATQ